MAQHTAPQPKIDLGKGFWPVAIGLTIFNAIATYFIVTWNIDDSLPELASTASDVDFLFKFLSVFGSAIFIYVLGFTVYFAIAWRRRPTDPPNAIGIQIHDAPKLEFWWTAIPSLLVVILAVFSVRIWANLQQSNGSGLTMESIGHQFNFEFRYANLEKSVYDEMHLPLNVPVTLHVTSADVNHSFWVPELRLKYDMVPGLVQTLRFTPNKVGKFRIICAEFCGTNHGAMAASLYVDTPAQFDSWIAKTRSAERASAGSVSLAGGSSKLGAVTFTQKCASCHNANGGFNAKIVGPGLGHLADDQAHPMLVTGEKPDAVGISHILVKGYSGPDMSDGKNGPSLGVMPNRTANNLTNSDIANLTAYLLSLTQSAKKS